MRNQKKYRLSLDAEDDIANIQLYTIEKWGFEQSDKYIVELIEVIELLAGSPLIGREHPEIAEDVRSFPHEKHIIYYIVSPHEIVIIGIPATKKLPKFHLENR